tara:strand:+ start:2206 stop:2760 length:555 start_codon:yes stop_codon:yes gene_type:complete
MATPLDTGLLNNFSIIFPFLLVFCITYAIFLKSQLFDENKGLAAIIALVLGILVLFFPIVRDSINVMAPWFVLLMFAVVFIIICFMIFGFGEGDIMETLRSKDFGYINTWVVGIGLLIVFGSITSVISDHGGIGESEGGYTVTIAEDGTQENSFWDTITHPKVLGAILILLIGSFTVSRLSLST